MEQREGTHAIKEGSSEENAGVEQLILGMKDAGINGAVIRNDGLLMSSTISITDSGANTFASLFNVCDALLKTVKDAQREVEISAGGLLLVLLPVGNYLLCGVINNRDQKKTLREYAEKLKQIL